MKLTTLALELGAVLLLSGCRTMTVAPVDPNHPASVSAPESRMRPLQPMLGVDEATRHTRDLLAQRAAEARAAENEAPGNEANVAPGNNQPAGHEQYH